MTSPLLIAHNHEREKRGLKPLSQSSLLTAVAQRHAETMAENGRVFHGDTYSRIYKSGYKYSAAGENVAGGQPTIQSVMTDWMRSPGHRQNILSNKFTEAGFGVAADDRGFKYWTAVFARPVKGENEVPDDVVVPPGDSLFRIPPVIIGPSADALPLSGEVNWGMKWPGLEELRNLTQGEGVVSGIVDTGVDLNHPLLANCFAAKDFTGSRYGAKDVHGHGSHVTGTVAGTDPRIGVAYKARVVHGKGLSDSGSGSDRALVAAMDWCVSQGAELLSCSWGSSGPSSYINDALRRYCEAGVWPVFAAGNSGGGTSDVDWPGRSEWCISVAALNQDLTPATFTSAGAKIDTSGPGVNIWSAKPGGGVVQMSGTSMATPWVDGALLLYRSVLKLLKKPIPSVAELRAILFSDSTDTHTPGDDRRTGPGYLTPLLLTLNLTPDPPPVS